VFWVHASSAARFEESYKIIAERVRLVGWAEPKVDILGMVYRWLSDESNGRWAMVVDNADSADVMFEPWNGGTSTKSAPSTPSAPSLLSVSTDHSLSDYLPSSSHGSIMITSRSREVAEGLIEYTEDILELRPMDEETAVNLFRKKLKSHQGGMAKNDSVDLVQQLDCMPLAITQAAAYINQRAPRITVSTYLETLKRSDDDRAKLLLMDIRDPRRDGRASSSIIATWHISFEHIRQIQDSAARLLALMSLFDREAIPDYLLREQYIENRDGQNNFEEDIATLRAYHLINTGVSENLFDMHRLVQFSTRKWLELHAQLERWQTRYVNILCEAFPTGDYVDWRICRALFPHVEAMVAYRVDSTDYLTVWATVLYRGSWYAWASGRYGVAERMAKASLEVREEVYGLNYVQTLDGVSILGLVQQYQGKYDEAESMNRRALAGYEKVLEADHPSTLTSVDNLASVLRHQGQYDEAESMNRRALAGKEKVLGMDHPSTLTSVSNLAGVLRYQGKYNKAESMNRRALEGREKVLGVGHPDTLASVDNLALVLRYQGKYNKAESMNRRALEGKEKVLGVGHPDTLTSVSNLALVL
jgi:tetratricopeptide (TPR) repeat protein